MATASATQGRPANVVPHKVLYWFLWAVGLTIVIVGLYRAFGTWNQELSDYFDKGPTILLFVVIYLALSAKVVRENEVAAAFMYGKALAVLPSGPHFVWFGLMQIKRGPRAVQNFQCPGEPEQVFKGDDKEPLPPGMVRAIRIVTGDAKKMTGDDMLNSRMTIVVNFFVQWAIINVLDFASNYGTKEAVEKQIRDIGEAILAEIGVSYSPATFIDNLKRINAKLSLQITDRFANSGVHVISTRQISPDVSHEVSKALANIPRAKADAKATTITAEGKKAQLTKEGEGKAAAELASLNARAAGQKKMKDDLGVSGDAVLAAQAVRDLSDKTDVIVAGAEGGMKDLMGLVKGAQAGFNSGNKTKGVSP